MTEHEVVQMVVGALLTLLVAILSQIVAHGFALIRDKRRERLEDEDSHHAPPPT